MKITTICRVLFLLSILTAKAQAYTAADYYNAGLQLYNTKNYPQATQYFSAALSLDPNNAAALQGRANCYYAQGQYQQALTDYQKVLSLNPSNAQLSQFVQALQAKVGVSPAGAAAPASTAPGATVPAASASFDQGVALYQQRQYAAAVPYFQKAVQENPNDSKAYYYLGATQMMMGDTKNAAVALGLSNKLQPNPGIAGYVNQLKTRLTPEDQQWVDSQIASGGGPKVATVAKPKTFGIRLEPAITLLNLADFDADAQASEAGVKQLQQYDPSATYNAAIPVGCPNLGLEPVVRLGSSFEIGLPFAIFPVGTVTETVASTYGNYSSSYAVSAFSIGLDFRYLLLAGDFQPFIGAGGLLVPISINAAGNYYGSTSSGSYSGTAAGGQVQLGVDWHLGDTFVVSPYGSYQFATANSFTGTSTTTSGGTSQTQSGQLMVVPNPPYGNSIFFIQNGTTPPDGSRPLIVDLSGITGGLQLSVFF